VRLRLATTEDAGAVAALFRRSYASIGFLPTLHTPEEDLGFFGGVIERDEVWVAEDENGRVLGFAALGDGELGHLYVDPPAQGRGVGAALFAHAQERRPDGFRLWVFQENARARRFYEARGCVVVELTDGAGNEEREPDARYEWRPVTPRAAGAIVGS
jgi:ribosomal protein S18 acetylase RimI-like enzyme